MHTAAAATDNRNAKANKVYLKKKEIEKAKGGWGTGVFSGLWFINPEMFPLVQTRVCHQFIWKEEYGRS